MYENLLCNIVLHIKDLIKAPEICYQLLNIDSWKLCEGYVLALDATLDKAEVAEQLINTVLSEDKRYLCKRSHSIDKCYLEPSKQGLVIPNVEDACISRHKPIFTSFNLLNTMSLKSTTTAMKFTAASKGEVWILK